MMGRPPLLQNAIMFEWAADLYHLPLANKQEQRKSEGIKPMESAIKQNLTQGKVHNKLRGES